jgi:hypothetical protein
VKFFGTQINLMVLPEENLTTVNYLKWDGDPRYHSMKVFHVQSRGLKKTRRNSYEMATNG